MRMHEYSSDGSDAAGERGAQRDGKARRTTAPPRV
jgi:hypothetical protein